MFRGPLRAPAGRVDDNEQMNSAMVAAAVSPWARLRLRLEAAIEAARSLGEEDLVDSEAAVVRLRARFTVVPPLLRAGEVAIVRQRDYTAQVADWPVVWRRVNQQLRDYHVAVPFVGDRDLVQAALLTCAHTPQWAVGVDELRATFTVDLQTSGVDVRRSIDQRVADATRHLEAIRPEIDRYHADLDNVLAPLIQRMAAAYEAGRQQRDQLGPPTRTWMSDVPAPSTAPVGSVSGQLGGVSDDPFDHVVRALHDAAPVLATDQTTTEPMVEEELRTLLAVFLRGRLEGFTITAEELRARGKTDILVRRSDHIIAAIIECKIWRSPAEFSAGLDQLMSYLTHSDQRAAYVLFIRDQPVTSIRQRARELAANHANYAETAGMAGPDVIEFRFHATGDPDQSIRLALVTIPLTSSATGASRNRGLGRRRPRPRQAGTA